MKMINSFKMILMVTPRFYVDEEYSQPYTGFTEDYLNQKYFKKRIK